MIIVGVWAAGQLIIDHMPMAIYALCAELFGETQKYLNILAFLDIEIAHIAVKYPHVRQSPVYST